MIHSLMQYSGKFWAASCNFCCTTCSGRKTTLYRTTMCCIGYGPSLPCHGMECISSNAYTITLSDSKGGSFQQMRYLHSCNIKPFCRKSFLSARHNCSHPASVCSYSFCKFPLYRFDHCKQYFQWVMIW